MAGLLTNPGFQRAMLKKRALALGGGQSFNTADITKAFAADRMQRGLQFQGIEDQKRRAFKGISQRGRMIDIDEQYLGLSKKKVKKSAEGLELTAGVMLGTSLLSGLEGRRRRGAVAEANKVQAAQRQQIIDSQDAGRKQTNELIKRMMARGRY
jgi:hypothetical protein